MAHGFAKRETVSVWADWSPSYSNITIGDGTVVARFIKSSGLVVARWEFTLGATSSMGTAPNVSLPITAATADDHAAGLVGMDEAGVGGADGICRFASTGTEVRLFALSASGSFVTVALITSAAPFTWGAGDLINFVIEYEPA